MMNVKLIDFGTAISVAKIYDARIKIYSWSDDEFVFVRPKDILSFDFISKVKSLPNCVKDYIKHKKQNVEFEQYMCKFIDGKVINGWIPSQEEAMSESWILHPSDLEKIKNIPDDYHYWQLHGVIF